MQSLDEWLEYISRQHWQNIDMGLDRMRKMVARLDLQTPAPKVITVAGTNGKGSTCVACETLLRQQGVKTGVTLSPHVTRFNERIRIDGCEADDALIVQAMQAVAEARGDTPLTYFEFSALAALWCFKHCAVEVAVLEIGLGGRLDAFNVIDADVAVITSIGLDHEAFLGDNRETIGREKAGILRAGQQVVLGADMPASVLSSCTDLNLTPQHVEALFEVAESDAGQWNLVSHQLGEQTRTDPLTLPYGGCPPHNLLLAYLAVTTLHPVPLAQLSQAAASIRLPGRMQQVMFTERQWWLDVAHNPAAATFLLRQLRARSLTPAAIVCGMLRDKRHAEVFSIMRAELDVPWFCIGTTGERGMDAAQLAAAFACKDVQVCADWPQLLRQVNSATPPGSVILAFGSFNLIEQFHQIKQSLDITSPT